MSQEPSVRGRGNLGISSNNNNEVGAGNESGDRQMMAPPPPLTTIAGTNTSGIQSHGNLPQHQEGIRSLRHGNDRSGSADKRQKRQLMRESFSSDEEKKKAKSREGEYRQRRVPIPFKKQLELYASIDKKNVIDTLYRKNFMGGYPTQFAYLVDRWRRVGIFDPECSDILNINTLDNLRDLANHLSNQLDIWGLESRTKLMRIEQDISKFIQLLCKQTGEAVAMVSLIAEHKKTLLTMVSYLREVFIQNIEDHDVDSYFFALYYPVKRAGEVPNNRIACRFLIDPLLPLIRERCQTIECRYLNLLYWGSGSKQVEAEEKRKGEVAVSLMKIHSRMRELGREIACKHDYLILKGEEREQALGTEQEVQLVPNNNITDVHDMSFKFYQEVALFDQELYRLSNMIHGTSRKTHTENNDLFWTPNKTTQESAKSDEKSDFQMYPLEESSVTEHHRRKLENNMNVHEREIVEFIKFIYSFDIAHRGGINVYRHPLLTRSENNEND